MKKIRFIVVAVTFSCINPIEIPIEDPDTSILVVEGYITTRPGPHPIVLRRLAKYGSVFDDVIPLVNNAHVSIRDGNGIVYALEFFENGIYQTPSGFMAEVGKSYSLQITIENDEYISKPQVVLSTPPIDEVRQVFKIKPSNDPLIFESGVELYVQFQDNPMSREFYLWTITDGVYPFVSRPDLFAGNFCPPTATEPEFAIRYERNFLHPRPNYDPLSEEDICIRYPTDGFRFEIWSNHLSTNTRNVELAAYIRDDGRRFIYRYRCLVNQMKISPEAHKFYTLLETLDEIEGDIFDPPPVNIAGNIVNIYRKEELVIGYFGAYDVAIREVYIDGSIITHKQRTRTWNNDHWKLDSSVLTVPEWWEGEVWGF